ncbi:MAG: ATP-binding protein [bacterium]|nr:ATP-binding protein [bacterium]MCM1374336.1 ATP-binding protein [Muribaculum sp.]
MEEAIWGEGFSTLEEQMQAYVELFYLLQQGGEDMPELFEGQRRLLGERERETDFRLPSVCLRERYVLTETEYWTMMFGFCCELEGGLCLHCREQYQEPRPTLQYTLHLLSLVLPVDFSYVARLCGNEGALKEILELSLEGEALLQRPLRLRPEVFFFLLTGREGELGRRRASQLGRLIEDDHSAEEMILPADCRRQLEVVLRLARAWQGKKGLQLMFHGSSGTGKTMAASVLARELQLPLFKVDLSRVFDKYIGETEKHVDEIFRMAERDRYLLFFDEADALFSKRTGVKDSHDRYANVSASYLLQRMEDYEGILILATNLKDHFDDAFLRRIRFVIRFRNLDREGREQLWYRALAGKPPAAQDVECGALARAAELSPARICAAAQVARLLASSDKSPVVTRAHLLEALELEAGKDETAIGRI